MFEMLPVLRLRGTEDADSIGDTSPSARAISSLPLIEEDDEEAGFKGDGTTGMYEVLLLERSARCSTMEILELLLCGTRFDELFCGENGFEVVDRNSSEFLCASRLEDLLPACCISPDSSPPFGTVGGALLKGAILRECRQTKPTYLTSKRNKHFHLFKTSVTSPVGIASAKF